MWELSVKCIFCTLLQLYPSLCELAHVLSVDGPVRQKLDSLAGELAKAADKELQVIFLSHHSVWFISVGRIWPKNRLMDDWWWIYTGNRGLHGVSVPWAMSALLCCSRMSFSPSLLHLRAGVHPSIVHPHRTDGESGSGHQQGSGVREQCLSDGLINTLS